MARRRRFEYGRERRTSVAVTLRLGHLVVPPDIDDDPLWHGRSRIDTTNLDECVWSNVTCDVGGRVTALNLDEQNVWGQIPDDLGLLTDLTYLDLESNRLTGTIPSSLGLMTALVELGLDRNVLQGIIPFSMGDLTALESLQLWGNKLSGTIPSSFQSLTALTSLGMIDNVLTGTIPSSLSALMALRILHLFDNRLVGTVPFCTSDQAFEYLVSDCAEVSCTCCTHCCPAAFGGIPFAIFC